MKECVSWTTPDVDASDANQPCIRYHGDARQWHDTECDRTDVYRLCEYTVASNITIFLKIGGMEE